jgi:hypothetical protein
MPHRIWLNVCLRIYTTVYANFAGLVNDDLSRYNDIQHRQGGLLTLEDKRFCLSSDSLTVLILLSLPLSR